MMGLRIWSEETAAQAVVSLNEWSAAHKARYGEGPLAGMPIPGAVFTTDNYDEGEPLPAHDARLVWGVLGGCSVLCLAGLAFLVWWWRSGCPWLVR